MVKGEIREAYRYLKQLPCEDINTGEPMETNDHCPYGNCALCKTIDMLKGKLGEN